MHGFNAEGTEKRGENRRFVRRISPLFSVPSGLNLFPSVRVVPPHHSSLKLNCTWRDAVDVCVNVPATGEGAPAADVNTIRLGVFKFVLFSRLKISARNCIFIRSNTCVSFSTEKSHVPSPGPVNTFLPTLPNVPESGTTNAAGLNHCVVPPRIMGPVNDGFHDGRTGFLESPSLEGLKLSCGVNGNPD